MSSHPRQIAWDAILFDLDGVLIDSTESVIRHWKKWADAHGLDVDKIMQVAYGMRTVETMRLVAPHLDAESEAAAFGAHEARDTTGVVAIEGAAQTLASLPEDRWAIVTSCTSHLARARLKQARLPVPRMLIAAEDVTRGKPSPDPYFAAADRFGFSPARCVVIEDSPAGIAAAKGAAMPVIGLATTHSREDLLSSGADLVITGLSELSFHGAASDSSLILRVQADSP